MSDNLGTITILLHWDYFDGNGKEHHRIWTLKGGEFELGEVWKSMAGWCWQICGNEDKWAKTGYQTLEEAQNGLIEAVKRLGI